MIAETMTQTAIAVAPPADPWDAPYFGGIVYFSYRPTPLPTPATSEAALAKLPYTVNAWEPWDAPYFGAPIYLNFPGFSDNHVVTNVLLAAATRPGEPEPALAPQVEDVGVSPEDSSSSAMSGAGVGSAIVHSISGARQNWLTRLFGGWRARR